MKGSPFKLRSPLKQDLTMDSTIGDVGNKIKKEVKEFGKHVFMSAKSTTDQIINAPKDAFNAISNTSIRDAGEGVLNSLSSGTYKAGKDLYNKMKQRDGGRDDMMKTPESKGSPFKLKSQSSEGSGTIFSKYLSMDFDTNLGKVSAKAIQGEGKELNNVEGKTIVFDESSKAATVADQVNAAKAGKSKGDSAFDRDGRSVDKFDQRIADAESKGKLGRVQRLKNRKGGYMESQANKLEKAGGTLSNQQKIDLNKAGKEAKGTRVGRALRVLGNREAKERKVDPVAKTSVSDKKEALTNGTSSSNSNGLSAEERKRRRQASGNYNTDGSIKKDRIK